MKSCALNHWLAPKQVHEQSIQHREDVSGDHIDQSIEARIDWKPRLAPGFERVQGHGCDFPALLNIAALAVGVRFECSSLTCRSSAIAIVSMLLLYVSDE